MVAEYTVRGQNSHIRSVGSQEVLHHLLCCGLFVYTCNTVKTMFWGLCISAQCLSATGKGPIEY